tara:strand:+ start:1260 stop:1943 length:684 start_codon:yes stop_codon:yes gene_type:complete
MSAELSFDRIDIGDVHYMDSGLTAHRSDSSEAVRRMNAELDRRYVFMRGESGIEPGCSELRESVAIKEHALSGGGKDFVKWRREREAFRRPLDPITDLNITMLARTDDNPVGGVLMYSINSLGVRPDGVTEIEAYCGPFTENPEHTIDFMLYLLDNQITGRNINNEPTTYQLVKWNFPVNDARNRWFTDRPLAQRWIPRFSSAGYDLKLTTRVDKEFARSLELSDGT